MIATYEPSSMLWRRFVVSDLRSLFSLESSAALCRILANNRIMIVVRTFVEIGKIVLSTHSALSLSHINRTIPRISKKL